MTGTGHICLFGASGRTGREIVADALSRGYRVTAVARSTASTEGLPGTVDLVRSDFDDDTSLARAIDGADAVLCVLGPRQPYHDIFCAAATRAIIRAMITTGVRRLICVTGAMIGNRPTTRSLFIRTMMRIYRNRNAEAAADRDAQERAIVESDLDWTIVKPPRLTDGPTRHRVRSGEELPVTAFARISRRDLAGFMIDQIDSNEFLRKCPVVRY